tara:strand:+ start:9566 stop:9682 length:117 start_codon:yes stop_codon:yes gene_type:complete
MLWYDFGFALVLTLFLVLINTYCFGLVCFSKQPKPNQE